MPSHKPPIIASLKASTENLGDYIQIAACLRLLDTLDLRPSLYLDRDTELASPPLGELGSAPIVLPLSGWFKHMVGDDPQWPPHHRIVPVFVGFHVRPHQCPALLQPASIEYMKLNGPIGCRDPFTKRVLEAKGVPTYLSHCLSLTFPRREPGQIGDTVVVASRDRDILDLLPPEYRNNHVYVNHYTSNRGFAAALAQANDLLEFYRTRARIVITTFLHCALPCIGMGIPVVVFLPRSQTDFQRQSDEERFSDLLQMIAVHQFGETTPVDWTPPAIDVEELKKTVVGNFQTRMMATLASLP